MRIIKFRGKGKATGKWLYGDLTRRPGKGENVYSIYMLDGDSMVHLDIDPATIGQHTGMEDAEGTEIYEGDILRIRAKGWTGVVEYHKGRFAIQNPKNFGWYGVNGLRGNAVVTGNIHNKEEGADAR